MTTFHLVHKGGWLLTQETKEAMVQDFRECSKAEAVRQAAEFVISLDSPGSLRIHREDGTLEEERTFPREADPKKSEG